MYLDKIIAYKQQELEHRRRRLSLRDVRLKAENTAPPTGFLEALRGGMERRTIAIIAEVKKASPSVGVIRRDFNPVEIAQIYEDSGASALSVLTDGHFFQGSLSDLEKIRGQVRIPLLRKDFTFDAYQIYEARGSGADAVLLIVRILEEGQLKDYLSLVSELGMNALVEVHNEKEMQRAALAKSSLIGINNRDLKTFQVDLETSVRLSRLSPPEALLVSESGIVNRDDIEKLSTSGIRVFLIGETLLKEKDPGKKLKELLS